MSSVGLLLFLLCSSFLHLLCSSQPDPPPPPPSLLPSPQQDLVSFRPSVAIIIGIFSVMFSLTFLLLMYAKFCHAAPFRHPGGGAPAPFFPDARFSGLDKAVVESLPFFCFSALGGTTHGLDCAVCLATYGDADLLRLLPGCNHAFHLHCVDRWLAAHSSCPLCRKRVEPLPRVLTSFRYSASSRSLFPPDPELALYLEREPAVGRRLHRTKHRVVVPDAVFKNRWSDLNPADLMSLNSEMLRLASSARFDLPPPGDGTWTIREEIGKRRALDRKATEVRHLLAGSSSSTSPPPPPPQAAVDGKRCASEITSVARRGLPGPAGGDEKIRRLWLPIARRTVQWLHGREARRPTSDQPLMNV